MVLLIKVMNEQLTYQISWIKVRYLGHPTGTDSIRSVDKYHGKNRDIVFGLYALVVIKQRCEQRRVSLIKDVCGQWTQLGEDVPKYKIVKIQLINDIS